MARLANTLGYELIKAEAQRDSRIGNLDAFDLTMRGRALQLRYQQQPSKENSAAARAMYEQALAIDPNDAVALAGEAFTLYVDKAYGWTIPGADYDAKVLGLVDRSIALAHDDPLPYYVKGQNLRELRRLDEALRADDAGLAINPNSAPLHAARGLAEMYIGHYEQGKTDVQQAMRLSPRDPNLGGWHDYLCLAELGLAHYDAAIDEGNRALDAGYRVFFVHMLLAAAHALKGETAEAKTALAEARRRTPNSLSK